MGISAEEMLKNESNMDYMKEMIDKIAMKRTFISKLEGAITPGLRVKRIDVDKLGKINVTYFPVMELSAEQIFKELGYEKVKEKYCENGELTYVKKCHEITFDKEDKTVNFSHRDFLDMKELKAINQQVKELGWLDKE